MRTWCRCAATPAATAGCGCGCSCGWTATTSSRACWRASTRCREWSRRGASERDHARSRAHSVAAGKLWRVAPDRTSTVNRARSDGRREPVLGDLDGLQLERRVPRAAPARGRRRWIAAAVLAVLVLAAGAALRSPLGDGLWPQARVHALTEQAAAALARGHLTDADGSGARELYEAARAIDPDQPEPRAGLARVAEAALAQAAGAVSQDRFADAHALLQLARELSIPRERADALADRLHKREAGLA